MNIDDSYIIASLGMLVLVVVAMVFGLALGWWAGRQSIRLQFSEPKEPKPMNPSKPVIEEEDPWSEQFVTNARERESTVE